MSQISFLFLFPLVVYKQKNILSPYLVIYESNFMSEDFTQQWLSEIQALKQQVTDAIAQRHGAWESAEKWRKLYNTESEQRRSDSQLLQQEIATLKTELYKIKGMDGTVLPDADSNIAIQMEIAQIESLQELRVKLIAITKERDRLLLALKNEQESHSQTRKSLTTALGDAIDSLTKERAAR